MELIHLISFHATIYFLKCNNEMLKLPSLNFREETSSTQPSLTCLECQRHRNGLNGEFEEQIIKTKMELGKIKWRVIEWQKERDSKDMLSWNLFRVFPSFAPQRIYFWQVEKWFSRIFFFFFLERKTPFNRWRVLLNREKQR